MNEDKLAEFEKEVTELINKISLDNWCSTPDFILAEMLVRSLKNWKETLAQRERWFNAVDRI